MDLNDLLEKQKYEAMKKKVFDLTEALVIAEAKNEMLQSYIKAKWEDEKKAEQNDK